MKKLLAMLLALVMVLSFAACSNEEPVEEPTDEPVVEEPTDEPEEEPTEEPAAATYTLGMGVSASTGSTKDGNAQADVTVAVVVLDAEGKIVKAQIDCAQTKLNTAEFPADLSTVDVRSKWTKKEDYGMVVASPIGAEWYTQVDALEEAVVGMTAADLEALELVESNGHMITTNEAIYAGCTMDMTGFKDALVKACNDEYAKEFSADSFTLGLAVETSVGSSKAATADAAGLAALYTNFTGVAYDAEGKVLACLLDVIQVKISFDAAGVCTQPEDLRTKKELKGDYGMLPASAIGVEWMDQATAFEAAVVGMTAEEVAAIETVESNGHQVPADETLHAACSMDITGFQSGFTASLNNVK
ncbi:MAG: hypothetical protein IKJ82_05625 [Oscillospiraceae bacterium]|nr:hypothetical protein [Oscillospiraceae bacterium]